ncbi:MAG: DUF2341 domain-containing protein [Desulfobacteraceae bacterium]|nr:MAG: DUF2341 domain-containing protein [Desulfobacteraceae bacterium]
MKKNFIHPLFLKLALAIIFCMVSAQTVFAAFPTGWNYRKSHIINAAAGAGTNYQIRITANYGAGTDSGETVYLNSLCRTDFADIRFVASDGITELSYWMEEPVATGVQAVFWVKVSDDLSAVNQSIYVYYGNASATTTSNGLNTFIFFDDFNATLNLTKWARQSVQGVYPRTEPVGAETYLRDGGGVTANPYGWTCLGSQPSYTGFQNNAVEFRYRVAANGISEVSFRGNFAANTGYKGRSDQRPTEGQSFLLRPYQVGVWTIITPPGQDVVIPAINTWYRGTITAFNTAFNYYRNNVLRRTVTNATYAGPGQISLQNHYGSYTDYDWVSVRKFVNPQPAHSSWGAQEAVQANLSVTKSVALHIDADLNQVVSIGDTLRYNVKILNSGTVNLLGAVFTDPIPPANTTYAPASVTASSGAVNDNGGAGPITWTGDADIGVLVVITFDVTVNAGTPLGTVITNQGTVNYDANNDGINESSLFSDGNPATPGIQVTNVTVGGYAHGFGTKTAVDLNGGNLEPGDILEYTIKIENRSGFVAFAPLEFTDVIPANTKYVPGFTTVTDFVVTNGPLSPIPPYSDHTPVITYTAPTLTITGIDIGATPPTDNVVTITFRVQVDSPITPGVTQISNQATVFYDSDSNGVNDTYQATDGDGDESNGNQPTVSPLGVYSISGTVFDDNGAGGGTAGNNIQDGTETGLSGVEVNLWDEFFTLLYGYGPVSTDINGYYIFMGLPAGNYGVEVTDPAYYTPTLSNQATGTVPPDDTIDFGYQNSGDADLSITKECVPLRLDGTNQFVFNITVTNNGPDTATNVILTDDLDALAAAGLSNIEYTEDGGARAFWPLSPGSNTLPLGNLLSGTSKAIRIFANVDPAFITEENTATVISDIFDPDTGNNAASCTSEAVLPGRRLAMEFIPASNRSITIPSSPSLESISATGTIEAWIYVKEFNANSELIGKGTLNESFDIGLCGGGIGDEFEGGTAQNIGFALYDTSGTQYLLIADNYTLNADQWYHVACVWDLGAAPQMTIYINGVEEKTSSPGIAAVRTNTEALIIGYNHVAGGRYVGLIDEVRVWDVARVPSRIRDTMCRKITAGEPDYSDLMGNWRFDGLIGNPFCDDISLYGNIGFNNAARVCSSAPVGDASGHDYVGSVALDFWVQLAAGDETLTATGDEGTWDDSPATSPPYKSGLQVYRVNNAPDYTAGPLGMKIFPDSGYWGVFVTGGTSPSYKVEYNYDVSNDGVPGVADESALQLSFREGNCRPWMDLGAVHTPPVLAQTGLRGTEFILGTNVDPRNTIYFNSASSNYVAVTDGVAGGDLDPTTYGTIEAWINITSYQDNAGIIHKGNGVTDSYSLYMGAGASNNLVYLTIDSGGGTSTINSATILNLGTWYHIAGTWDAVANTMTIYINGVQETTGPAVTAQDSSGDLYIGVRQTGGPSYFNGYIDEVRIWNIAAVIRTQTQIRDTMCQKLIGNETDLGAYWRFDEETNSVTCPDYSGNGHTGTMTGFGADLTDLIRDARVCSSAPIGDDSSYAYYDGGVISPVTAQLTHSDGDYMDVTENTTNGAIWNGPFSGLHIYRVDEAPVYPPDLWEDTYYDYQTPNGLTPPAGWSSIDYYRYWGVFVTDWDDVTNQPEYDVVYHYAGNPSVPADDSVVALARRPEYCFGTWTDSGYVLDSVINDTLTVTGDSQYGPPPTNPEYILGGKDAPLAITLASFAAEAHDGCINVHWETATEIDTAGFYLWRSNQKDGVYTRIEDSFTRSEAKAETMGVAYKYMDCGVDEDAGGYYYKLEEVDFDNAKDNPFYGPIGPVAQTVSASQPVGNESKSSNGNACFIDTLGM